MSLPSADWALWMRCDYACACFGVVPSRLRGVVGFTQQLQIPFQMLFPVETDPFGPCHFVVGVSLWN